MILEGSNRINFYNYYFSSAVWSHTFPPRMKSKTISLLFLTSSKNILMVSIFEITKNFSPMQYKNSKLFSLLNFSSAFRQLVVGSCSSYYCCIINYFKTYISKTTILFCSLFYGSWVWKGLGRPVFIGFIVWLLSDAGWGCSHLNLKRNGCPRWLTWPAIYAGHPLCAQLWLLTRVPTCSCSMWLANSVIAYRWGLQKIWASEKKAGSCVAFVI